MTDARVDGTTDWELDLSRRDGWPVAAGLLSVIALIALAVAARYGGFVGQSPFVLFAALAAAALLIWGVAYAVTIRHAGWLWSAGLLVLLLFLAMAVAVAQITEDVFTAQSELQLFRGIRIGDDGAPILPPGADRGPTAHVFVRYFTTVAAIDRDETAKQKQLGMDRLVAPEGFGSDSGLWHDCGRFTRHKPELAAAGQKVISLVVQLPKNIEALAISPVVKRYLIGGLTTDLGHARQRISDSIARNTQQLDVAQTLCTILAHHHWVVQGGRPMFTSIPDMNAYNQEIARWNAIAMSNRDALAYSRAMVGDIGRPDGL